MINFKITTAKQTDTDGLFFIEPLEGGFGHTMGNCLRRVLLNNLEGAAISSVKIAGAPHQFTTIPGISEDVTQIILNLKQVRIKIFSDKPIRLNLQASGKGEVKASDIDTTGTGEIVNPNLHIASLNDSKAKLNIVMTAEKGVGYLRADEKKTNEIGTMSIDALYSPVMLVDYTVEPTRVGRRGDFDKLTLRVVTDGSIKPEEALAQSARLLREYFKQIYEPTVEEEVVTTTPSVFEDTLKMSVEELDLPVRITNALKAIDINIVNQLVTTPKGMLMKAKNLGTKSLSLISEKLSERGLTLSEA